MAITLRLILFISFVIYLICFSWGLYSSEEEYKEIFIQMLTSAAGLSIIVAFFALWLTLENFLRKTSLKITGKLEFFDYKVTKSGYSFDSGLASFQLNNYKDKTVVIYKVYLYLRKNIYIEILDTSKNPILLKAYDTYFEKLEKPLYYEMNNEPKVIKDLNLSKAILYLDTNEGKYKVKKGAKHWIPNMAYTLVPKNSDYNYDLNIKFYFADRSQLALSNYYTSISFGQEYVDVRGKEIYVGEIETVEDLKELLQKESPTFSGYDVWQPINRLNESYPDWLNAKPLDFNSPFSMIKNKLINVINKKYKIKEK